MVRFRAGVPAWSLCATTRQRMTGRNMKGMRAYRMKVRVGEDQSLRVKLPYDAL